MKGRVYDPYARQFLNPDNVLHVGANKKNASADILWIHYGYFKKRTIFVLDKIWIHYGYISIKDKF